MLPYALRNVQWSLCTTLQCEWVEESISRMQHADYLIVNAWMGWSRTTSDLKKPRENFAPT